MNTVSRNKVVFPLLNTIFFHFPSSSSSMDTAQWPQEIKVKPPMEEMVPHTYSKPSLERKIRPQKEQALNCPRCNSTNTKFCYYNNYSLSQPRFFCKTCRRYWTEGGTLRSIPVGGGSRKNKRSSSSSSSPPPPPSSSSKKFPDLVLVPPSTNYSQYSSSQQNPKIQEVQDLNLAFPSSHDFKTISELIQVPNLENNSKNNMIPSSSTSSAMELLTGISSRGLNPFIPTPISDIPNSTIYSSGFEFKPTLNFSLDHGLGSSSSGYGSTDLQETSGRLLFPFEDLKQQVSTTSGIEQNRDHDQGDSNGYWNIGMLGGGSW